MWKPNTIYEYVDPEGKIKFKIKTTLKPNHGVIIDIGTSNWGLGQGGNRDWLMYMFKEVKPKATHLPEWF